MAQLETTVKILDRDGVNNHEIKISEESYAAAANEGLSLTQHLNNKYPDAAQHGDVMAQILASSGLVMHEDHARGFKPTKMSQLIGSGLNVSAGAIISPDGSQNGTVAGRIVCPEILLSSIETVLREDRSDYFQGVESLLSGTESLPGIEYKRPIIDVTAPEGSESQPTAQLAEPASMVSITTSDRTFPIPVKSIGLMISDQAAQNSSIDLVRIAVERQAFGERVRQTDAQLSDVLNGNTDLGLAALPTFTAQSLDAAVTAAGTMSQLAWITYLRQNYTTMNIDKIVTTLSVAQALESRSGKPIVTGDDPRGGQCCDGN